MPCSPTTRRITRATFAPRVQKPDFVVLQGTTVAAVLDAKYRDLWQDSLPRDMLYQLALYALGPAGAIRRSTIVYPTLESAAMDQVIAIQEPIVRHLQGLRDPTPGKLDCSGRLAQRARSPEHTTQTGRAGSVSSLRQTVLITKPIQTGCQSSATQEDWRRPRPPQGRMQSAERRVKAARKTSLALQGPQSRKLRPPADQRSAPHLNRPVAEMPQGSRLDKLG